MSGTPIHYVAFDNSQKFLNFDFFDIFELQTKVQKNDVRESIEDRA